MEGVARRCVTLVRVRVRGGSGLAGVDRLSKALGVPETLVAEDVHGHRVMGLEAVNVFEGDGHRDAGRVQGRGQIHRQIQIQIH